MAGLNLNIGLSTIKRESKPKEDVERALLRNGWEETESLAGDRLSYFENTGINVTVLETPRGTLVFPSGPIRGSLFGEDVKVFSRQSALGLGAGSGSEPTKQQDNENQVRGSRRSGDMLI